MSLSDISSAFAELSQCKGQVSYVFLTRAPLTPKGPFDLHVLGTPPAFILSQDQTLHEFVVAFTTRVATRRQGSSVSLFCC